MQTFLPYANFIRSAECLDYRRLCKQRLEARETLYAITESGNPLRNSESGEVLLNFKTVNPSRLNNHPAIKMWRGYAAALVYYGDVMIAEWVKRGYQNTMLLSGREYDTRDFSLLPVWIGDERVHASHRANLLRKDPKYYSQFGWVERPAEQYFWLV